MARTSAQTVKPLNPRQADQKYMGDEPVWTIQPEDQERGTRLIYAFKWYNYYYSRKDAKDLMAQWLDHNGRKTEAKQYRAAPESAVDGMTHGWLARMNMVGLHLLEEEVAAINDHVKRVISVKAEAEVEEKATTNKPNIQDRLREKALECGGEIEGLFDEFLTKDCKLNADYKPGVVIRSMNIQPQQVNIIAEPWKTRMSELNAAADGKDEQLTEGYAHLTRSQLKAAIKFCELVINDCATHIQHKKAERKPRAKKAVSPEKLTAKFKWAKECADLQLKSESVTKLVDASEAWLYDKAKRKLIHVVADAHLGTFTVKGSSVIGFDPGQTEMKTLRKPKEQVMELFADGKPGARKYFKDIKTTSVKWNGRSSENLMILRAW